MIRVIFNVNTVENCGADWFESMAIGRKMGFIVTFGIKERMWFWKTVPRASRLQALLLRGGRYAKIHD